MRALRMSSGTQSISLGEIRNGSVLDAAGEWADAPLRLSDGWIGGSDRAGRILDAAGCRVLPGIVDFHGDGFERLIMPRPRVHMPLEPALAEADRQLAANGITTALHGVTCSWEGGLRGPGSAARLSCLSTAASISRRLERRLAVLRAMEELTC